MVGRGRRHSVPLPNISVCFDVLFLLPFLRVYYKIGTMGHHDFKINAHSGIQTLCDDWFLGILHPRNVNKSYCDEHTDI